MAKSKTSKKAPRTGGKKKAAKGASPREGTGREERSSVDLGDVSVQRGSGGETHQNVDDGDGSVLTTAQGVPISDDQNTLTVGPRGPQLLEDFVMREKIFHFDHERIPERVVHARGYGAKGVFETYQAIPELTAADLFARDGQKSDVFVRFSTVAGNKGSPDLARDVRGFAVKFYTDEGNWDLVGNNMPVFFIQDAIKFPDLVHAAKAEPDRGFPQAQTAHDNFWDFASLMPESTNMLLWTMSDRAIPRSFRFMEGFGVHTFRLIDADGGSRFAKFHWKPLAGLQSVVWDEAVKINGADPDFHRRDLWHAIERGDYPQWELGLQVFDDEFADEFPFDVLDATKLIPEEDVPVTPVGRMTLNQNVDNFFAETEQVAFCTQNVVPGIGFTNDPLLQGRNFSYLDTQLKRLGSPNFTNIPVNAPRCPVAHFQRDGHMTTATPTGRANYEPNSWGESGGPRQDPERGYTTAPVAESGETRRVRAELFADHYSQARQFYRSQTETERAHIADAFAFELSKVERPEIRTRMVATLRNVDEDLARDVADGLGLENLPEAPEPARAVVELDPSPALSIIENGPDSFAGRKLGVLVADGADAKTLRSIRAGAEAAGVVVELVAPTRNGISNSDGDELEIAEKVAGGPSVLFDAVALVLPDDGSGLEGHAAAVGFVTDALAHGKFIGFTQGAEALLAAAGAPEPKAVAGCLPLADTRRSAADFIDACGALRVWDRQLAASEAGPSLFDER